MALAPLLYNITFDSQTRILYFWDKAGHEIYHCEIPSPAPALPTVSVRGDFGDYNWIVNGTSGSSTTINAGSIWTNMYISGTTSTPRYKSSKSYAALYRTETNGGSNIDPTVISLVNGNPQIGVKNISSSTITLYAVRVAVCSDNTTTVITVYDSNNNPYNAFKYTSDGTDYYYVLDGTQTDWTDDLSSIGYHVPPALPTVEMINSRIGTLDSVGTISSWSNGDSAYQWRSIGGVYSLYTTENTSYIVCCGRIDNTTASNAVFHGFDAEFDLQGHIKITNNTGSTYSNAYSSLSYICKNSSATVITVYDSSNNPYNAFKYTSDGADYYYVLDGTQTDWTDDLSSIGYHVPPAVYTAWLSADKSPGMYTGSWHNLFDDNGNYILLPGVTNDQLSVVDWYDENDNLVEFPESVSDRGILITSLYSDSRLMFGADSWPYPYTAPSMLTRITYVINQ